MFYQNKKLESNTISSGNIKKDRLDLINHSNPINKDSNGIHLIRNNNDRAVLKHTITMKKLDMGPMGNNKLEEQSLAILTNFTKIL